MSKDPRALSPDVAKPYIDAGAIEQHEIDAFEEGGKLTSRYSMIGSAIGIFAPNAYYMSKKGIKIGFLKSIVQSTACCVAGGAVGTAFGAWRMTVRLQELNRTPPQIMARLGLYQALSLHQFQPLEYGLPPIPDPSIIETYQFGSTKLRGVQPPSQDQEPSRANPWAGKAFPQPPRVMDGVARETQPETDARRDSNGRLFPGFTEREDENGDRQEDADGAEKKREREREMFLGGGRLGMDDGRDMGTLASGTRENSTSWALLRSRAPTSSATISTSSTPPPSDFSFSSLPPPSISPSSSSNNLNPRSSRELSDREKEQAEFDRLLELERGGAVDGQGGSGSWASLRGGGGGGGGTSGKESVW